VGICERHCIEWEVLTQLKPNGVNTLRWVPELHPSQLGQFGVAKVSAIFVRFEVLTAAGMKMDVFWVVAPCSLMMEAVSTSETSVNFYQAIWCNIPEDSLFILVAVRSLNLKNYSIN
jgi:hypothetical protein